MTGGKKRIDFLVEEYSNLPAEQFVRAVNDCYYSRSAISYDATPDIAHDAVIAWQQVVETLIGRVTGLRDYTIVDIGSGTGFVAERMIEKCLPMRAYVGFEPSEHMRSVAAGKITDQRVSFRPLDVSMPISESICAVTGKKILTMNSVLHHVVWWEEFLSDLVRCMKAEDILILCHEPNSKFWNNESLVNAFDDIVRERKRREIYQKLLQPSSYWNKARNMVGLRASEIKPAIELMNEELTSNGTLRKNLPHDVVSAVIDYSVPLCWRNIPYDASYEEGFLNVDAISGKYLTGCRVLHSFTYQHVGFSPSILTPQWRRLEAKMAGTMPDEGAQFCVVAMKQ